MTIDNEKAYSEVTNIRRKTEKKVAANFKNALDDIRAKLMKLAENGSLTLEEINRYNRADSLYSKIDSIIKGLLIDTYKDVKNSSTEAYQEQQKNMDNMIADALLSILAFKKSSIKPGMTVQGKTKIINSIKELEKKIATMDKQTLENKSQVSQIIREPVVGMTLKQMIQDKYKKISNGIKIELNSGYQNGESIQKISARLKHVMEINAVDALRIARTETLRASSLAQQNIYEKMDQAGVRFKKKWIVKFGAKHPRHELYMDGVLANDEGPDGEFTAPDDGRSMGLGPRQTWRASDDINCFCSLETELMEE